MSRPEPERRGPSRESATGSTDIGKPAGTGFLGELKRRGVIETALAYAVLGWLLLQISDVAFDQLSLPAWVGTFVAYLVVVGFPIALVLAWFLRFTPSGPVLDDAHSEPSDAGRPLSRPYVAIIGALVLASLSVYIFDRYVGLPGDVDASSPTALTAAAPVDPNSIAVLPFFSISGTDEGQIFSDGLTEDVINRLARVPGLLVSSRGDSYSLAPNATSDSVRARLRVAYYIEGSVRVTSDMLRVVVQLINSETGFHLVSRSFDRARADFFEIQDEITQLAVANMRVALPEATRATLAGYSNDANLDAYLLYHAGMNALYEPRTQQTIDAALATFQRSLSVDSDYAAAHAGTCMTYVSAYLLTRDPEHIDAAEQSCHAALGLNGNLDVVHNALGELYFRTGEHEAAEGSFRKALAINTSSVDSLIGLGGVYLSQQRLDDAEQSYERAIGLQPGNWQAYNSFGGFLYLTGRYTEAADQYGEIVSIDPENITGWTNLASSLLLSGDFSESASSFERAIEIEPTSVAHTNLGLLKYYSGEYEAAIESLRAAADLTPNDFLVWSNLGDVLSYSAAPDRARSAFERAEELAESELLVNSRDPQTMANLAWIKAMLGHIDDAEGLVTSAREIAAEDPYVHYIEALILAKRGDHEAALQKLSTAIRLGYPRALIAAEPHLIPVRSADRFTNLVEDYAR